METLSARHVVLGAGAMGSATAYHLARRCEPVLLLEQFAPGHDRGSSHGAARIIRHSYADARYARLMPEAFLAWEGLERDAGEALYTRVGGVTFCRAGLEVVDQIDKNLTEMGIERLRMDGRGLRRAFPAFEVPDDTEAVFEPDAGMLSAARAVEVQIGLARQIGGDSTRVLADSPVRRIDLDADRPTLLTDRYRIIADRLIVTAGAWTGKLLPSLPIALRPTLQKVFYFRPPDASHSSSGRLPVFIFHGEGHWNEFYGMPPYLGRGIKVARHGGPDVDPDAVDRTVGDEDRRVVRRFLATYLPGLADAPIDYEETCLYTMTPDSGFRIVGMAARPDVLVASPCSGHGFKFSCLIGRILADLAQTGQTSVAVDFWRGDAVA